DGIRDKLVTGVQTCALPIFMTTEGNEGNPGGDAILVFAPDGTESTFATDLSDPRGIAFDPSGDLLVAELKASAQGDILKFSTNEIGRASCRERVKKWVLAAS